MRAVSDMAWSIASVANSAAITKHVGLASYGVSALLQLSLHIKTGLAEQPVIAVL